MDDAWDRAVAAEARRCEKLGFVFQQPNIGWRQDAYWPGDLVKLGNVRGPLATYRVGPTGRVTRMHDGGKAGKRKDGGGTLAEAMEDEAR